MPLTRSFPALGSPAVWAIVLLCVGVETVLALSDAGRLAPVRLRPFAYANGSVWPGLLVDWRPNFAAQPWTMFFTYGFLHVGLSHLVSNMAMLLYLAGVAVVRLGEARFLALYAAAALGGGLLYALIAPDFVPMVGASGAVFGLAGAIVAWDFADRRRDGLPLWPSVLLALYLNALNIVTWWAMDGRLAWQTHLGGFLAGAAAALLLERNRV